MVRLGAGGLASILSQVRRCGVVLVKVALLLTVFLAASGLATVVQSIFVAWPGE